MKRPLRVWLYGLFAGVLSAIGDAGSTVLSGFIFAPALLQSADFWHVLGGTIAFSAGKTVFAYLKASPIPRECVDDEPEN